MNKKGFTLVEIIALVMLLSIILTIAFTSLSDSLNNSRESEYKTFVANVEMAAETYVNLPGIYKGIDEKIKKGEVVHVRIEDLINAGLIDQLPENPSTKKELNGADYILVQKNNNNELIFTLIIND